MKETKLTKHAIDNIKSKMLDMIMSGVINEKSYLVIEALQVLGNLDIYNWGEISLFREKLKD